eukprot:TCONS_00018668-protein
MVLFENKNLRSCWGIALSELETVLHIHRKPNHSFGDTFKALIKALQNLNCEIWLDFFFYPKLSSQLITEYRGENGFEEILEKDIKTIKFDSAKEVNIKDLLNTFMERTECNFPYEDEKYCIHKDESVYARKFFQSLPE